MEAIPTTLEMESFYDIGSPQMAQYISMSSPLMDTATSVDNASSSAAAAAGLPSISSFFPCGGNQRTSSDSFCSDGHMSEHSEDESPVYAELKSISPDVNQNYNQEKDTMFEINDNPAMDSWKFKHPEEWGSKEILDWIYYWLPQLPGGPDSECSGENFSKLDGRQLIKMSEEEFCKLEPSYGKMYYHMLHKLLQESMFNIVEEDMNLSDEDLKNFINGEAERCINDTLLHTYDYDQDGFQDFKTDEDDGYVSTSSGEYRDQIPATVPECDLQDRSGLDTTMTYDLPGNRGHMMQHHAGFAPMHGGMNPRPQMGRPRIRPTSESSIEDANAPPAPKKRGRRLGQVSNKGNHLWEFIRDLLKNPATNPTLIRWEDEENGVFRIVQSKKVSDLWGKKKNNPAMNYEKLSRAMRHYYKSEILDVVLGRRLVYRFGKNATGWQKNAVVPAPR